MNSNIEADNFTIKYLNMFDNAKSKAEKIAIINKIYECGFEDGANDIKYENNNCPR